MLQVYKDMEYLLLLKVGNHNLVQWMLYPTHACHLQQKIQEISY